MSEENLYELGEAALGEEVYKGLDASVIIYGVVADVLLLTPILLYLFVNDTNNYA